VRGVLLFVLLLAPPLRGWLESSMTAHMLVQIPLLVLSGWLAAASRAPHRSRSLQYWNPGGAPGLLLAVAITTTWMVPRALDLAVTTWPVDVAKALSLALAGALGQCSWARAGAPGQAFFVGNVAWMAAVVGLLLRDAPVRVCTSYLARDQWYAGTGLLLLATAVGVRWFVSWLGTTAPAAAERGPMQS